MSAYTVTVKYQDDRCKNVNNFSVMHEIVWNYYQHVLNGNVEVLHRRKIQQHKYNGKCTFIDIIQTVFAKYAIHCRGNE